MGKIRKSFGLILILIFTLSSLMLIVKPINAQIGVTTPLNPSFGVRYEIYPIHVQPVYGVDQSTGKAIVVTEGYTAFDETVFITIMNQPFVPYKDSNGNSIQLFYGIRWKAPSNNSWVQPFESSPQSNEERTISTFDFKDSYHKGGMLDIPLGTETQFQVQAMIGYFNANKVFVGKTTDWINQESTQSAGIPDNFTPTVPSVTPTVPEFPALIILPLFAVATLLSIVLIKSRIAKKYPNLK